MIAKRLPNRMVHKWLRGMGSKRTLLGRINEIAVLKQRPERNVFEVL